MFIIKLVKTFLIMAFFLIESILINVFIRDKTKKLYAFIRNTSKYSNYLIKVLNIKLKISQKQLFEDKSVQLIISNHLSWLDILLISSIKPSFFVTSLEVKNNLFLGPFAIFAGSYFVNRKNTQHLREEVEALSKAYQSYYPLCLFPEATSSNGQQVLGFKNALLQSVVLKPVNILAFVINYLSINDKGIDFENKDNIFWYGDMGFFSSLIRICRCKEISVNVKALAIIKANEYSSRKALADSLHKLISEHYIPIS